MSRTNRTPRPSTTYRRRPRKPQGRFPIERCPTPVDSFSEGEPSPEPERGYHRWRSPSVDHFSMPIPLPADGAWLWQNQSELRDRRNHLLAHLSEFKAEAIAAVTEALLLHDEFQAEVAKTRALLAEVAKFAGEETVKNLLDGAYKLLDQEELPDGGTFNKDWDGHQADGSDKENRNDDKENRNDDDKENRDVYNPENRDDSDKENRDDYNPENRDDSDKENRDDYNLENRDDSDKENRDVYNSGNHADDANRGYFSDGSDSIHRKKSHFTGKTQSLCDAKLRKSNFSDLHTISRLSRISRSCPPPRRIRPRRIRPSRTRLTPRVSTGIGHIPRPQNRVPLGVLVPSPRTASRLEETSRVDQGVDVTQPIPLPGVPYNPPRRTDRPRQPFDVLVPSPRASSAKPRKRRREDDSNSERELDVDADGTLVDGDQPRKLKRIRLNFQKSSSRVDDLEDKQPVASGSGTVHDVARDLDTQPPPNMPALGHAFEYQPIAATSPGIENENPIPYHQVWAQLGSTAGPGQAMYQNWPLQRWREAVAYDAALGNQRIGNNTGPQHLPSAEPEAGPSETQSRQSVEHRPLHIRRLELRKEWKNRKRPE